MRLRTASRLLALLALALALPLSSAHAGTVVAPNANAATSGDGVQFFLLDTGDVTFQWAYSASQLGGIAAGSQITGIGFRLPANVATVTSALNYSSFNLEVGTSVNAPGSLSTTFASNQGADTTLVLSGPLTVAANSFVGGFAVNPFFNFMFSTPYTYNGGDLLFTVRHSAVSGPSVSVDANLLTSVSGITDTVGTNASSGATTGTAQFFNSPITQIVFDAAPGNAVPEPSTVASLGLAGLIGLAARFRRRLLVLG